MGNNRRIKAVAIAVQAGNLKRMFPEAVISTIHDYRLTWTNTLSPSPLGGTYKIKLIYETGSSPKVYVVDPTPLFRPEGKSKLPHCYDSIKQHLCLYYPNGREWNKSMLLTQTIIPWTYEWLYHYEIWLINGGYWTGGGAHPTKNKRDDRSGG